jgi:transcriptional regulator with PAS, ATPase and Fis domain
VNDIVGLLRNNNFVRTLVDSLPCGLLIVDSQSRVQAVNNLLEGVLGIPKQAVIGKGTGDALGCLHVTDHPEGCGFGEYCQQCEAQQLVLTALSTQKKQKNRVYLELIIDGQLRDLTILLSAVPFNFDGNIYGLLLIEDVGRLKSFRAADTPDGFRGIVGRDSKMEEMFDTIRRSAVTDAPVLITGESGVGKELVAVAIHKESPRVHKPFVPVNCGALPEGLLESELFGHTKGAFTGALRDKRGRFELADGGSIFLDEVGELSPATQVKLLRVLQEGRFERLGSEETVRVNVRVISATNKNLEDEMKMEHFRQDLYYRLCVMPIVVPPLRDRREDIPLLARHFINQFSDLDVTLSHMALLVLMGHTWPGNVRELQNTLQYALAKCQGQRIEEKYLPPALQLVGSADATLRRREPKLRAPDVARAMREAGGKKRKAAEMLGVSRSTLYRFLDKLESD